MSGGKSDDYTPTDEQVATLYGSGYSDDYFEFYRWLANHDAKVTEAALASTPSPAQPTEEHKAMMDILVLQNPEDVYWNEVADDLIAAGFRLTPSPVQGVDDRLAAAEAIDPESDLFNVTAKLMRAEATIAAAPHAYWCVSHNPSRAAECNCWKAARDSHAVPLHLARDPREVAHMECDCVPDLGPSHCHKCGDDAGHPVSWADSFHGEMSHAALDEVSIRKAMADAVEDAVTQSFDIDHITEVILERFTVIPYRTKETPR